MNRSGVDDCEDGDNDVEDDNEDEEEEHLDPTEWVSQNL